MGNSESTDPVKQTSAVERSTKMRVEFDQRIDSIFNTYGHDHSGTLSRQEVTQLIRDSLSLDEEDISKEQLDKLVDSMACSETGRLKKQDVASMFRRMTTGKD